MRGISARPGRRLAGAALAAALGVAAAAPSSAATGAWPMFGHDRRHTGVSTATAIRSSNASGLGIRWQANTGQAAFASPAVAHVSAPDRTLVYIGNSAGFVAAYRADTGARAWFHKTGASVNSSPAVVDGVVYVGSSDEFLYALNARTGDRICRFHTGGRISSSPLVVDPAGGGKVVYIGDNGPTGGDDGGSLWAINAVDPNPAGNCSRRWRYSAFGSPPGSRPEAGVWSPPAFARDRNGRPLVVFGSSSRDNAVYALDARTGQRVWRFQTKVFHPDNDVGAGPTISPPGANGFADGVVYVAGKNRIVYALNLRTGRKIWQFSIRDDAPAAGGATRSTAALVGRRLYVGYGAGVYALNAVTGRKVWRSSNAAEVISSPAVTGPPGRRVLVVGDLGGRVRAYRLGDGASLWSYETGGFIYGSAAVHRDRVFIASSDGFLYAFGVGGGASAPPNTRITKPQERAVLPNQTIRVAGSATDNAGVRRVLVAVKNKNRNQWWDGREGEWVPQFTQNAAALANPRKPSTSWAYTLPAPPEGGVFYAQAEAVDGAGQHDPTVAQLGHFEVKGTGDPPDTRIRSPVFRQVFHLADPPKSFRIKVSGTATDSGGANPGIDRVKVVVKNIEHGEYYCGPQGCDEGGGGHTANWRPTYTVLLARVADRGKKSTNWSFTFPTYDHEHKYRITAWAVDEDGEQDQTRAVVARICVRKKGEDACA